MEEMEKKVKNIKMDREVVEIVFEVIRCVFNEFLFGAPPRSHFNLAPKSFVFFSKRCASPQIVHI